MLLASKKKKGRVREKLLSILLVHIFFVHYIHVKCMTLKQNPQVGKSGNCNTQVAKGQDHVEKFEKHHPTLGSRVLKWRRTGRQMESVLANTCTCVLGFVFLIFWEETGFSGGRSSITA